MPKIVDHAERRREILVATWRVIERVGLDEATTRRIAEEAGYSNGVLAHYFADKDDILVSALTLSHAHVRERMQQVRQGRVGVDALRAVIEEAMPLDEERLLEARVELSFLGRALNSERLRRVHAEEVAHFRASLRRLVAATRDAGELTSTRGDDDIASEILVLVDGLSVQAMGAPRRTGRRMQLALLDALLASISGSVPSRPPARRRPRTTAFARSVGG